MDDEHGEERWEPAAGFLDYEVSTAGRVRRAAATGIGSYAGRLMRPQRTPSGRLVLGLSMPNGRKRGGVSVAKLVLLSFRPAPPDVERVTPKYLDGDPSNVALTNLAWQTKDAARLARMSRSRRPGTTTRACLRCSQDFQSTWIGHRLCNSCGHGALPDDAQRGGGKTREVLARIEEDRKARLRRALRDPEQEAA